MQTHPFEPGLPRFSAAPGRFPKDCRREILVLTAIGERHLERLREPAIRAQKIPLSAFTPDEAETFLSLLGKFVDEFNGVVRAPVIADADPAQKR